MHHNVKAVNKVPDTQFLQRLGTTLLLMAIAAGSVTVVGAAISDQSKLAYLPAWQLLAPAN